MESDDSASYVGHDILHENPDSPSDTEATGEGDEGGGVGNSARVASRWASRIMVRMSLGFRDYAAHAAAAAAFLEEPEHAAEDLGQDVAPENQDVAPDNQDVAPENPDSNDSSSYDADTISDSPNSSSSTLKLNLSSDSSSECPALPTCCQDRSIRNFDEAGFRFRPHMPLHLPRAAAAEAAVGQYIRNRNGEETAFSVCALHSGNHLHSDCPGCRCTCKAEDIGVQVPAANIPFFDVSDEEDDEDSPTKDM